MGGGFKPKEGFRAIAWILGPGGGFIQSACLLPSFPPLPTPSPPPPHQALNLPKEHIQLYAEQLQQASPADRPAFVAKFRAAFEARMIQAGGDAPRIQAGGMARAAMRVVGSGGGTSPAGSPSVQLATHALLQVRDPPLPPPPGIVLQGRPLAPPFRYCAAGPRPCPPLPVLCSRSGPRPYPPPPPLSPPPLPVSCFRSKRRVKRGNRSK